MPRILAVVLALFISEATAAAEITITDDGSGGFQIDIAGPIQDSDPLKLQYVIANNAVTFMQTSSVILSSSGGSVSGALGIAEIIEQALLTTSVPEGSSCASACFIIFVSGAMRSAQGKILVHRPYLSGESTNEKRASDVIADQRDLMRAVRQHLQDWLSVPGYLVDLMMERSSVEAYQLRLADFQNLGFSSPFFEEFMLLKCGISPDDAMDQAIAPNDVACVKGQMQLARTELLIDLIGGTETKAAMRELMILSGYGDPEK